MRLHVALAGIVLAFVGTASAASAVTLNTGTVRTLLPPNGEYDPSGPINFNLTTSGDTLSIMSSWLNGFGPTFGLTQIGTTNNYTETNTIQLRGAIVVSAIVDDNRLGFTLFNGTKIGAIVDDNRHTFIVDDNRHTGFGFIVDDNRHLGFIVDDNRITGNVAVSLMDNGNGTGLGMFSTAITQLDLAGDVGFGQLQFKLDPAGTATIGQDTAGNFLISSSFDIFFDVSLDSGGTFTPSTGSVPFGLAPAGTAQVPEPGTLALAGIACVTLARWRRSSR